MYTFKNYLLLDENPPNLSDIEIPANSPIKGRVTILGAGGIYTASKSPFWDYLALSNPFKNELKFLPKVSELFILNARIPEDLILRAIKFLRVVFEKHQTESVILPFVKVTDTGFEWALYIPKQNTSYGGIKYEPNMEELKPLFSQGFVKFGTIHSHCDFGAGHSGTDMSDEASIDGIHITVGKITSSELSLAVSAVATGTRFKFDNVLDAFEPDVFSPKFEILNKELFESLEVKEEDMAKVEARAKTVPACRQGDIYEGWRYYSRSWDYDEYAGSLTKRYEDAPSLTVQNIKKILNLPKKRVKALNITSFVKAFLEEGPKLSGSPKLRSFTHFQ